MSDKKEAGAITTKAAEKVSEKVRKESGLMNVTFIKDHGINKKGHKTTMHGSTASALAAHKVLEIGEAVKKVSKPKR